MSNETILVVSVALGSLFFLGMGYLAAKLFADRGDCEERLAPSTLRYELLKRLLAEEDFEYLSRQPGFDEALLRRLRRNRVRVFGAYLREMRRDFDRLHRSLRVLTVSAGHDRPEIARALIEQQVRFRFIMANAHLRLAFHWFGVKPMDLRPVVDVLQNMQGQVRQLNQVAASAASA